MGSQRLCRRLSLLVAASAVLLGGQAIAASPAAAVSPDVVISQVYGGGGNSGATYTHDFIELYNRSASPVSLAGWSVQWTSATGTSWSVTPLNGSIAAGAYYLIQQAQGSGGTTALPNPDAFGTSTMGATSGKVALRNTATACTGAVCSSTAGTVDFVGYGATPNDREGTANTPAPSNTTAVLRGGTPRGSQDTDQNGSDFTAGPPTPVGSGTGGGGGVTKIHEIQGTGSFSPKNGQVVTIEGIVTGIDDEIGFSVSSCSSFPRDAGIFVQEEDADADADPNTSEGIFVGGVSPRSSYPLGTKVRLTGTAKDGGGSLPPFDQTRIDISGSPTIIGVAGAEPLPGVVVIDPVAAAAQGSTRAYYESLEGMRVMVQTGVANAGGTNKFGELFLEPGTHIDTLQRTDVASRINARLGTTDDAGSGNPTNPLLGHASTSRVEADKGDTLNNVVGPLDYSFSNYKIAVQPSLLPVVADTGVAYPYDRLPDAPANSVRIASFNLENLFPTGGSLDCATVTATDYASKRADAVDAIGRLLKAPDVVAVQEIGDLRGTNPSSLAVLQELATDLGTAGYGSYMAFAVEGNDNRGIDVGFLVKNTVTVNSVTQYGKTAPNPTSATCGDVPGMLFDRPPLVLDATLPGSGGNVLVFSNHFSSKAADDACRVAQASYVRGLVVGFETAVPGRKIIVTGDLNAFEDETPLSTLTDPGFTTLTNLWSTVAEPDRYSFQFSGLLQTLDHMVVNAAVQPAIVDFRYAHLSNDYYERSTGPDGHRLSDHDPPVLTLATQAAFGPPEPTGFDGAPDVIVGGGAPDGYLTMQRIAALYSAAPGCTVVTSGVGSGRCNTTIPFVNVKGNVDHDVVAIATPSRSDATSTALATGPQQTPPINFGRVGRPKTAGDAGLTFWGFGRDAVAFVTFGSRTGVALTKQQLKDMYTCSLTDWSQVAGAGAAGAIIPWAAPGDSDVGIALRAYLDDGVFGPCVRVPGGGGQAPDAVSLALGGPTVTLAEAQNMLWPLSFGSWQTYPHLRSATVVGTVVGSNLVQVAGVLPSDGALNDGSYPVARTISLVARSADVAALPAGPGTSGADNGASGAVRSFTEWLCRSSNGQHETSRSSGRGLRTEVVRSLNLEGLQAVPGALRSAGYGCIVA